MKITSKHIELNLNTEVKAFDYLISSLKETIHSYDFFVDWKKALKNTEDCEISLNILNSLIGKNDLKNKLKTLILDYPNTVQVIPLLIAKRDSNIIILDNSINIEYSFVKKEKYSEDEADNIAEFAEKCGLLKIIEDKNVKNLVDYTLGIEVGLDSNARKNRSGKTMETLIEMHVKNICNKHNFDYIAQATAKKVKEIFNKEVSTDKSSRCFDYVINTPNSLYIIETNFYSGGGSKLKSVSGEFSNLNSIIKNENVEFIWVTDGKGWMTAKNPLKEAFNNIDNLLNIKMLEQGILESILTEV